MKYVIYHKNCSDGTAAALAAYLKLKDNAKYLPMSYGEELPKIPLCDFLYIVDFSLPRDVLERLHKELDGNLVVLDHHKTAEENLKGLPYCVFDMNKCGAVLAWEYFHSIRSIPPFFQYIQDRDIWTKKLPFIEEASAYIDSYPNTIQQHEQHYINFSLNFNAVKAEGSALLRYRDSIVKKIGKSAREYDLSGDKCLVVNSPLMFASDVGNMLCIDHPEVKFVCCYNDIKDGVRQYSLRSEGDFDVSEIAKRYGGGGHKNAAGFTVEATFDVFGIKKNAKAN
jgi:oligoribonuclease NrnB/cAMP/cGMP phosphodiesterase (DHH superfamily)